MKLQIHPFLKALPCLAILLFGLACSDVGNKTKKAAVDENVAVSGKEDEPAKQGRQPAMHRSKTSDALVQNNKKYDFPWLKGDYAVENMLINRIAPPPGSKRVEAAEGSFAEWLRHLPLQAENSKVYLFNGKEKANQGAHYAVVDIDIGKRDLQQCADAVMRLKAEYLYASNKREQIGFDFTNGERAPYSRWAEGYRVHARGNAVEWRQSAQAGDTYEGFRRYMDKVFTYAGTFSLNKELKKIPDLTDIKVGDVFIQGGFPGHAVLVTDVAIDENAGETYFLLLQSYMPAQNMHLLHNLGNEKLTPWYALSQLQSGQLYTPEWTFGAADLKRFGD